MERYDQYEMEKKEKVILIVVLLVLALIISWIIYDSILFMPLGLAAYRPACRFYRNNMIKKRNKQLALEFNDFLYYISVSFSLGRTMAQAMEEGKNNIKEIYGDGSLLVKELDHMLTEISEINMRDTPLLNDFAARSSNEDIIDFVSMYENCKESGGNIMDAINTASNIITEKILIEDEILSNASQRKLEGRIIAAMPFVIILFLKLTGPDYIDIMYSSLAGRIIMTLSLLSVVVSWILVDKITRVKI